MARAPISVSFAILLCIAPLAHAAPRAPRPDRAQAVDTQRRLDVNELNMFVSNVGSVGMDVSMLSAGLFFPRGTGNFVVFGGGLWVGGVVAGLPRLAVAEYAQEFGPGAMIGDTWDNPDRPEYVVWKVVPWTGDPADTSHLEHSSGELAADPTMDPVIHHGWGEYLANAAPYGAPVREWTLPGPGGVGTVQVPGPDVSGDQMLWSVFNDASPANHYSIAGSTQPLGIEVHQSVFAFNRSGPLARTAFVRWRIFNHSGQTIDSSRVAFWLDPDLGGAGDDLVGSDSTRSLGFAYNATNNDIVYGASPPAVGVDFLDDAFDPSRGRVLGMASFGRYINGTDPSSLEQTWNILRGSERDGSALVNPTNGQPTTYAVSGDPVSQSGWLDTFPSDRRMILVRGARALAPGDSIDVTAAIIVTQGTDRLSSVALAKCFDDWIQTAYELGFPGGQAPPIACYQPKNCPRPRPWYAGECVGAGHLSAGQLDQFANAIELNSTSALWADGAGGAGFCAAIADHSSVRADAKAEFATLLANLFAEPFSIVPSGTSAIRLDPGIAVSVPGLGATTLAELSMPGSSALALACEYRDLNADHPPGLAGVEAGLEGFGGGGGYASSFFSSTLDGYASPADSFHTVQMLFDTAHPQKAYRFLRLEQADGSSPAPGRSYLYGGFFDVPFVARDSVTGDTLDVAFVERTVTDADGTILDPSFQLATFDSTWSPDASTFGGREYLMVLNRPYQGTPRAEVALDGEFTAGNLPWLYALWSRSPSPGSVIDPGDQLVFTFHHPVGLGADQRLLDLEGLSLGDPQVAAAYAELRDGLGAINRGEGIPALCDDPTPALASFVSASAQPGRVDLEWFVSGVGRVTVQRCVTDGEWTDLAARDADGTGHVRFQDTDVAAGARYGYRLAFESDGVRIFAGQAWVSVPSTLRLAIPGFRPNPSGTAAAVAFTLVGRERASLEIVDLAGRRVLSREVGALGPGTHTLALQASLSPGIYWLRLTQAGATVSTRGVVIR